MSSHEKIYRRVKSSWSKFSKPMTTDQAKRSAVIYKPGSAVTKSSDPWSTTKRRTSSGPKKDIPIRVQSFGKKKVRASINIRRRQ